MWWRLAMEKFYLLVRACVNLLYNCWWVAFFALLCYVAYEQSLRLQAKQWVGLKEQVNILQAEIEAAIELQKELLAQVNSQQDPAWIELSLMKQLGLVPEGQKKVLFTHDK